MDARDGILMFFGDEEVFDDDSHHVRREKCFVKDLPVGQLATLIKYRLRYNYQTYLVITKKGPDTQDKPQYLMAYPPASSGGGNDKGGDNEGGGKFKLPAPTVVPSGKK